MTIITKPLSEKKEGKLVLPLVENEQPTAPAEDIEGQPPFIVLHARARRVSTTTTLCLLLTALMISGIGVIGGTYLYRQYLRSQIFKGWCSIPYDQSESALLVNNIRDDYDDDDDANMIKRIGEDFSKNYNKMMQDVFNEQFEIDVQNENYEKIDVPDFRDGRVARFVHDFNLNQTGIIDVSGKRCFIMPLNRENVLPPKSLQDMVRKMWEGYYRVNTEVIRETMKVVTPPLTDMKQVGQYIAAECNGLPVYKLEKLEKGVWKRSAEQEVKFAQFSGKGILEFDIVNFNDIVNYEKQSAK